MKKIILPIVFIAAGTLVLTSCLGVLSSQNGDFRDDDFPDAKKQYRIIYFSPEIYPDVQEIKPPSYQAFFSTVSDKLSKTSQLKMIRVETPLPYDSVDVKTIQEFCENNNSDLAIVPKIKYFKVGIGKYVFSNQVIVSMKLYNAKGELISDASHDTFRENKRILGNTENSIKTGTEGVMKTLLKNIRKLRKSNSPSHQND